MMIDGGDTLWVAVPTFSPVANEYRSVVHWKRPGSAGSWLPVPR
jgi:hypothetical protein